jgi:hypothetical protein
MGNRSVLLIVLHKYLVFLPVSGALIVMEAYSLV